MKLIHPFVPATRNEAEDMLRWWIQAKIRVECGVSNVHAGFDLHVFGRIHRKEDGEYFVVCADGSYADLPLLLKANRFEIAAKPALRLRFLFDLLDVDIREMNDVAIQ